MAENKKYMVRAPEMRSLFLKILKKSGFAGERARTLAEIFTVNSLEGIYTHGVNRFARFIGNVREGLIIPDADPTLVHASASLEQWNGNLGAGPLNAVFATRRAMELADSYSIGLVALANTNHWMRGGYYGWQAAKSGYVFIGWTNTIANMPAWGASDPRLGNNPFVIAVPYKKKAIVLDFAMSLFSYGKMEAYVNEGKKLPHQGGYDKDGNITDDPGKILESWRSLPAGYWKGASLSLLLDILAALLSGGASVAEITARGAEYSVSQVFIAINISKLHNSPSIKKIVEDIIEDLHKSVPAKEGTNVRYPGENVLKIKRESLKTGIPVSGKVWERILSLDS